MYQICLVVVDSKVKSGNPVMQWVCVPGLLSKIYNGWGEADLGGDSQQLSNAILCRLSKLCPGLDMAEGCPTHISSEITAKA